MVHRVLIYGVGVLQVSDGRMESGSTTRGSASKRDRSCGLGTPRASDGVSPPHSVGLLQVASGYQDCFSQLYSL